MTVNRVQKNSDSAVWITFLDQKTATASATVVTGDHALNSRETTECIYSITLK
jgi:hypothetical protein